MLGLPPPVAAVGGGRFELHERIGHGTGGFVHRGTDRARGDACAVKMLLTYPEDPRRRRFLREARALQEVQHPRLVAVRGAGIEGNLLWFAMDYMPGGDLHRYVRRHGPVEPERALVWLLQVLQALDALHVRGLIHRDVKPHNIFLDGNEDATLGDLGIVRVVLDQDEMTQSGLPLGTEAYRAPEQDSAPSDAFIAADLYGAGMSLRYLLSGVRPSRAPDPTAPPIPADLALLLQGVSATEPHARLPSAQVMAVVAADLLDRRLVARGQPPRGQELLQGFHWPDPDAD